MRPARTITAVLFLTFFAAQLFAQVGKPLKIASVDGDKTVTDPEVSPFVPQNRFLRAVLHTHLTPAGETVFLYDDGADDFPETHLHALRSGKDIPIFDGNVRSVPGFLALDSGSGKELLGFAYRTGFNSAYATFIMFEAKDDQYQSIFEQSTSLGTMCLLRNSLERFEVWSADLQYDPKESCIWCPHRYQVVTYTFLNGKFEKRSQRVTKEFLAPEEISDQPFVKRVLVKRAKSSKPTGAPRGVVTP